MSTKAFINLILGIFCFACPLMAQEVAINWNPIIEDSVEREPLDSEYAMQILRNQRATDEIRRVVSGKSHTSYIKSMTINSERFALLPEGTKLDNVEFFKTSSKVVVNNDAYKLDGSMTPSQIVNIVNNEERLVYCEVFLKNTGSNNSIVKVYLLINTKFIALDEKLNIIKMPQVVSNCIYMYIHPSNFFEKINLLSQSNVHVFNYNNFGESDFSPLYVAHDSYRGGKVWALKGEVIGKIRCSR